MLFAFLEQLSGSTDDLDALREWNASPCVTRPGRARELGVDV